MPTIRHASALVVFAALIFTVFGVAQSATDERLIREARARSNAAIAAKDVAALAREWTDTVHVLYPAGF